MPKICAYILSEKNTNVPVVENATKLKSPARVMLRDISDTEATELSVI